MADELGVIKDPILEFNFLRATKNINGIIKLESKLKKIIFRQRKYLVFLKEFAHGKRIDFCDTDDIKDSYTSTIATVRQIHEQGFFDLNLFPPNIIYNSKTKEVKFIDFDSYRTTKNKDALCEESIKHAMQIYIERINRVYDKPSPLLDELDSYQY